MYKNYKKFFFEYSQVWKSIQSSLLYMIAGYLHQAQFEPVTIPNSRTFCENIKANFRR